MFSLFGRRSKKNAADIISELKRHVVQLQESAGVSYLAIAPSMLGFGISLLVNAKGPTGLPTAIEILASLIEEEQAALGSLGSSIVDIKVPQQPIEHHQIIVSRLRDLGSYFVDQGYLIEAISAAMVSVAGDIAKLIGDNNLFALVVLRKEYEMRCHKYRQQQLQQTATGEHCTEKSVNILLQAEADGFVLSVEKDGTFMLKKENSEDHFLRSNAEIERFGRITKRRKEAEEANRNPVERLVEQGHKDLRAQRLENAIGSYSAALRIRPDSAELYLHRGVAWSNTFYNRGRNGDDLQKAIDDYTRGIEIDPEYGEAYFSRAGLLSEQGQVAKAIADYGKAIEHGHQVSHSLYCRAHLWQSTGEAGNAKAITDFDEAIRTGDRHNQYISLMARGKVHHNLGNLELAIADLTAAAAYYPNSPPGLYKERAAALRGLGRAREAIADFDQAIAAVSPLADARFVADIYDQRGQCRMQLGESDLARQDFERAAQLKGQNR